MTEKCMYAFFVLSMLFTFFVLPFLLVFQSNCEQEKDYKEHIEYVGQTIFLNDDTLSVLEWRPGSYTSQRGYVLSNGMTVDEVIVMKNKKEGKLIDPSNKTII